MDTANPSGAVEDVQSAADQISSLLGADEPEEVEEEAAAEPEAEPIIKSEEEDSEEEIKAESAEEEADEESVEPDFQSVDDLAEALELSNDEFMDSINITVKVDGEESQIPLSELRNGYQREADYRRKTMELADNRRDFEAQTQKAKQEIGQNYQQSMMVIDMLAKQLQAEYSATDWNELRELDSGEFAAKQEEFRQRDGQIKGLWSQAQNAVQQMQAQQMAQGQQQFKDYLSRERDSLLSQLPEWKDEKVAKEQHAEIGKLLSEYGFSKEEIYGVKDDKGNFASPGISDHRIILLARDALRAKSTDTKKELAEKKVQKLPKVLKSGAKQNKAEAKRQANKSKMQKAIKSGSIENVGMAIADKL